MNDVMIYGIYKTQVAKQANRKGNGNINALLQ